MTKHSAGAAHPGPVSNNDDFHSEPQLLCNVVSPSTIRSGEDTQTLENFRFRRPFSPEGQLAALRFSHCARDLQVTSTVNARSIDIPPCSAILVKASSEMGIEAMLQWPVFVQRLSDLGIPSDETLIELLGQVSKAVGPSASDGRGVQVDSEGINLERETIRHLIENFLVNNNVKNPILDPVLLRRDAQEFVESGLRWDGRSCLIVSSAHTSSISRNLTFSNDAAASCPRR